MELRVIAKNAGGELLEGKTFKWSSSDPSVVTVDGSASASIPPLLDNTGLGVSDTVQLFNSMVSCASVARLEAKGVTVISGC